ncbi:putative F-box protein At2g02030 [Carex rostrata]
MEKPNKSLGRELPYLPSEIQQEILTWLPGKSLVRYQATCKLWKSCINDPTFAKKHFDRGGRRYKCINYFLNFSREAVFHMEIVDRSMQPHHKPLIDLQSLQESLGYNKYMISYSCNGIFCIYNGHCESNIILYNPLTKESVLLPGPRTLISGIKAQIFGYEDVYIGFIPSMDEYKIVCFFSDNGSLTLGHCTIFSLSSWSWNKITDITLPLTATPIVANGVMFWHNDSDTSVLWLDLATEQFGIIDPPSHTIMPDRILLSEVEGSLVLLYWRDKDYMSIWKLEDVARGIWMRCNPICKPIFVPVEECDSCFWGDVIFHQGRASFVLEDKLYINVSILGDSQVVYCFNEDGKRLDMLVQPNLHVHSLLSLKKFVPSNCGNC